MDASRIVDSLDEGERKEERNAQKCALERGGGEGRDGVRSGKAEEGRKRWRSGGSRERRRIRGGWSFVKDCRQFPRGLVASGSPNKLFRG